LYFHTITMIAQAACKLLFLKKSAIYLMIQRATQEKIIKLTASMFSFLFASNMQHSKPLGE